MPGTVLDNYDDFNFMVILLFLYFMLIGFIIMIIINANNENKPINMQQITQSNKYPQTTNTYCVPNATVGSCFF